MATSSGWLLRSRCDPDLSRTDISSKETRPSGKYETIISKIFLKGYCLSERCATYVVFRLVFLRGRHTFRTLHKSRRRHRCDGEENSRTETAQRSSRAGQGRQGRRAGRARCFENDLFLCYFRKRTRRALLARRRSRWPLVRASPTPHGSASAKRENVKALSSA